MSEQETQRLRSALLSIRNFAGRACYKDGPVEHPMPEPVTLVEQLRAGAYDDALDDKVMKNAADEIERLQAEVSHWKAMASGKNPRFVEDYE